MKSISDVIQQFIIDTMGADNSVTISRNELAQFFNCVPSQINYVLSTRFGIDNGYVVDSKRGGGGYITVERLNEDNLIFDLLNNSIGTSLDYNRAVNLLSRFVADNSITKREALIVGELISDKSLGVASIAVRDTLRANIFKSYLIYLLRN